MDELDSTPNDPSNPVLASLNNPQTFGAYAGNIVLGTIITMAVVTAVTGVAGVVAAKIEARREAKSNPEPPSAS